MPIGNRIEVEIEDNKSFKSTKPKYSLNDIIITKDKKEEILNILALAEETDFIFNNWGLKETHKYSKKVAINLYGEPGTGKTMAAHGIAHHLNKDIIEVSYSEIESKFVGETSKNLKALFDKARKEDSILFFDEADAILSKRVTNMSSSTDTSVNQTRSEMLILLNNYQGTIIFATNFIENFDKAFMRRILGHIEFILPNEESRTQIWEKLIPKKLPSSLNISKISSEYDNISGSDISNAILKASLKGARLKLNIIPHSFFCNEIENIIKSKNANIGYKTSTKTVTEEYAKKQLIKES